MTSTVLVPDTYGIDAAGFAHLASFTNVRSAGYEFVSLYVGGNFAVNRSVVERAWDAGLAVQLNYERSATAGLGGAALGIAQTSEGIQQSLDLGWNKESPLVWSPVDFSIQASQFPVVDAYHRALVEVCRSEGVTGGSYGPPFYLRHLAAQSWWPEDFVLWQWAGAGWIEPWTWAKQLFAPSHDVSHIGVSVDENVLVKPYKFWSGYGPDLDPQEDPMTPEESAKLIADVAEIKAAVAQLASLAVPAINADGSPVWKDPYGTPMPMSWQQGWPWELIQKLHNTETLAAHHHQGGVTGPAVAD